MSKRLYTIKSKKWYGRVWPPERRKVKLMQLIADYHAPEIEKKVNKTITDWLLYGIKPDYTTAPTEQKESKS